MHRFPDCRLILSGLRGGSNPLLAHFTGDCNLQRHLCFIRFEIKIHVPDESAFRNTFVFHAEVDSLTRFEFAWQLLGQGCRSDAAGF